MTKAAYPKASGLEKHEDVGRSGDERELGGWHDGLTAEVPLNQHTVVQMRNDDTVGTLHVTVVDLVDSGARLNALGVAEQADEKSNEVHDDWD